MNDKFKKVLQRVISGDLSAKNGYFTDTYC